MQASEAATHKSHNEDHRQTGNDAGIILVRMIPLYPLARDFLIKLTALLLYSSTDSFVVRCGFANYGYAHTTCLLTLARRAVVGGTGTRTI